MPLVFSYIFIYFLDTRYSSGSHYLEFEYDDLIHNLTQPQGTIFQMV